MFHLKELWSHLLLIILRQCLAYTLGPGWFLQLERDITVLEAFHRGVIPMCIQAEHLTSCLPTKRLNHRSSTEGSLLMCTLVSGDLLGLATCLLDNHHRFFPLGPVVTLFWLHSGAWHFVLLLVSFSYLPQDWNFSFLYCAVIGSQSLADTVLRLSLVSNWKRTVNNVYGVV